MHNRKAITNEMASRYQKATKSIKGQIPKELIEFTGQSSPDQVIDLESNITFFWH